ncbi:sensor histidine kinase [Nocardioides sp. CER19]|uniref:sensor histidine kinase n=1 Tax=Nocardioides sp. CER19 TaxID=3038538 RepID=UPI00244C1C22|nr:sensor histidine kinase [Nocardioides sp. CER19]MDH2415533.1 sensor domain-containing protein [Nocardioides sp. CER19]
MTDAHTLLLREDAPVAEPHPAATPRTSWVQRILLDTVYSFSALFVAVPFFVLVVTGLALSAGLAVLLIGVPVLTATVYVARANAFFERLRLQGMMRWAAPTPTYVRAPEGAGFWRRSVAPLRDPQSWLDVLWSVVSLVTGTVAFSVAVAWWAGALGGLTYWFWQRWIPESPDEHGLAYVLGFGDTRTAESWVNLAGGAVLLVTLPLAVRAVALLHGRLAGALLCSRAELQHEVARAETSRLAAQEAEASSLRRLERDIHDGPQQRLVRLTMDLGRARHRLSDDPDGAAVILDGALTQVQETVSELRALSRGVAPPLLVDRGLGAAVEELLSLSPVPVSARLDVPEALPPLAETTAYFVVAEAMTNIAKHSGASRATVTISGEGGRLRVVVSDDGTGGAHLSKGLGLAGLRQRLTAVGGAFDIDSPEGGPTIVAASIPIGAAR